MSFVRYLLSALRPRKILVILVKLSNLYSGYIHHRYIIWSDIEKCEIYFSLSFYFSKDDRFVFRKNGRF